MLKLSIWGVINRRVLKGAPLVWPSVYRRMWQLRGRQEPPSQDGLCCLQTICIWNLYNDINDDSNAYATFRGSKGYLYTL